VTGESSPGKDVPINGGDTGGVGTGTSPRGPSRELRTAVPPSSPPLRTRQVVGLEPAAGLCIGQVASAPAGHVHASWSATQNAAGATTRGAIWQTSQAPTTGPSAQRRRVIEIKLALARQGVKLPERSVSDCEVLSHEF
jgi:hypothetical protein